MKVEIEASKRLGIFLPQAPKLLTHNIFFIRVAYNLIQGLDYVLGVGKVAYIISMVHLNMLSYRTFSTGDYINRLYIIIYIVILIDSEFILDLQDLILQ